MDRRQFDIRECDLQETKVEAGAVEGDDNGVLLEPGGQVLEVLPVDENFIPMAVEETDHGHSVKDRRETCRLNVEEDALGCELREKPPWLAQG